MKRMLFLWLLLTPMVLAAQPEADGLNPAVSKVAPPTERGIEGPGQLLASPLMTEEYPLWVQDAVRSLRQQGLVSAGCLPDQALTRSDLAPLLDKVFQLQEKQEAQLAPNSDLQEIRTLMESLMEQTTRLNQRLDDDQSKVNQQAEATGEPLTP